MDIMDDVLDLMDSLGQTLEREKRRAKRVLRGESGFSTLIIVLVIMAVGAIIITPLLAFIVTGQKAGTVHKEATQRYYAADAGIQDGMWKVSSGDLPDWMKADWDESVYAHAADNYTSYSLPQINGDNVTVNIKAMWLLEGLETPGSTQHRTPNPDLTIVSNILPAGQMQIVIICNSPSTTNLTKIGVWIPKGFSRDTSVATNLSSLNPTIAQTEWRNGNIITFTFGTAVSFASLPGGTGNRRVITFNYTPAGGAMDTSWSWCVTDGTNPKLAWSDDIKLYQVESTATDPTGQSTSVISQTMTNESIGTYLAYYGDYLATGNALLRDVSPSDDIRETIYQNSPGEVWGIPSSATARKVMLYWSGFKHDPVYVNEVQSLSDAALQSMAAYYRVNQVTLTIKVGTTTWTVPTPITATKTLVVPDTLSGTHDGWSYSCYADITDLVKNHFGSDYIGNATFTVGHAALGAIAPTDQQRHGVWGSSSSNIYVVGTYGTILRSTDGTSWTALDSGTGNDLGGVWGADATHIYAVGDNGTIRRSTDGTSWTALTSGTTQDLYGVWGTSSSNIYAVGANGTILRSTNGTSWTALTSGTTQNLYSVWGTSTTNIYAVGAGGTILRSTNGTSWTALTSGTTQSLYSVWGADATHIYAVGASGTILYSANGTSWTAKTSGSLRNLFGIWGTSATNVYAVGEVEKILRSVDGAGATWTHLTGNTQLKTWVPGHSGESGSGVYTDFRLGDNAPGSPDTTWNLCSGAWSVITIYTSPVTLAHQMYLYDTFEYCGSNDYLQYNLSGFLAPAGVGGEDDAVRVTCFVSEGDNAYSPDSIWIKTGTQAWSELDKGANGTPTDQGNVWNGKSASGGTQSYQNPDCVDIDTFSVTKGYVKAADSAASIWTGDGSSVFTSHGSGSGMDAWNMVYIMLSFRSDKVGSGLVTYIVK